MDDAMWARDAAREALEDVGPERLSSVLEERLAEASMIPGALALLSARALEPSVNLEGVAERSAGVQLIYEGLRLTRSLAHEEPWNDTGEDDIPADLEIVAADVLVSRGFYLLARTEAADRAVDTVRAFGRDQTTRHHADDPESLDRNLEADVFALAVEAGATAVGGDVPPALREFAADLARQYDEGLPPAATLPESVGDRIASLSSSSGDDRVPSSATDT
jgi:hypothetical protein